MDTKNLAKLATSIDKYYAEIIKDDKHPDRKNAKKRAKQIYTIMIRATKEK